MFVLSWIDCTVVQFKNIKTLNCRDQITIILSAFDPTKEAMKTVAACVILCLLVAGAVQSCPSPSYLKRIVRSNVCVRFYQHDECHGEYFNGYKGQFNRNVGKHWNDKITSFVVLPGCEVQVY